MLDKAGKRKYKGLFVGSEKAKQELVDLGFDSNMIKVIEKDRGVLKKLSKITITDNRKAILKKVIKRAIDNGYKDRELSVNIYTGLLEWILCLLEGRRNGLINANKYYAFIFSHDFAKAFFGGVDGHTYPEDAEMGDKCLNCGDWNMPSEKPLETKYCWQMHLRNMVLCEEPLKYLEKFL